MASFAWLEEERRNVGSRFHWIPRDLMGLLIRLIKRPVEQFQGVLLTFRPFKITDGETRRDDLVVRPEREFLVARSLDGTIRGKHRLRGPISAVKISRKKIIYYTQHKIYQVSHDFKHWRKFPCNFHQLLGKTFFYSLPVLSPTGALVLRCTSFIDRKAYVAFSAGRSLLPKGDLCYVSRNGQRQVIASVQSSSQLFLNKSYVVWVTNPDRDEYYTIGVYHLQEATTTLWSVRFPGHLSSLHLVKHRLLFIPFGQNNLHFFNLLTGQFESVRSFGQSENFFQRYGYHLYKNQGEYQLDIYLPHRVETYQ